MDIIIKAGLELGLSPWATTIAYFAGISCAAAIVSGYCYGIARLLGGK